MLVAKPSVAQQQLTANQVQLVSSKGRVQLSMELEISGDRLPKDNVVILTPRLVGSNDSIDFPEIVVFGRYAYYHDVRQGTVTADITSEAYRIRHMGKSKNGQPIQQYARTIAHQPWMDHSQLKLIYAQGPVCDVQEQLTMMAGGLDVIDPNLVNMRTTAGVQFVQRDTISGQARIQFIVNRTEFVPELAANDVELDRIYQSIQTVKNDPQCKITRMTLKGYASPEGPYDNNVRLSKGRTERIRQYIVDQWGIAQQQVQADYQPEDWEGFRKYMVEHHDEFPDADAILQLIDQPMEDLDRKHWLIKRRHPKSYKRILSECFPLLRRTEYLIQYEVKKQVMRKPKQPPTTSMRQVAVKEPEMRKDIVTRYKPLKPWVAVKTNLLFDIALCSNVEVEVPLGLDSRWSIMAEYWNPWYVWHHNSRAYEIQLLGFEARYWPSPRCQMARPTLTGTFWGLYYANGKYDIEWASVGDQGEFNSVGLTFGYSWPLARRWNFEASVSAGYFWGPRRHYHGEFDDKHLIWKYTSSTSYIGPTKLKLSLVWLIGR